MSTAIDTQELRKFSLFGRGDTTNLTSMRGAGEPREAAMEQALVQLAPEGRQGTFILPPPARASWHERPLLPCKEHHKGLSMLPLPACASWHERPLLLGRDRQGTASWMDHSVDLLDLLAPGSAPTAAAVRSLAVASRAIRYKAWFRYLGQLEELRSGELGSVIPSVRLVFSKLVELSPNLGAPQAGPSEEHMLQLVWDAGRHHLEVDVGERYFEWFYRDRVSGGFEGAERCPVTGRIPPNLGVAVGKIAHGPT